MEEIYQKYQATIGLAVHMQLLNKSKSFSTDRKSYGVLPDSAESRVLLDHPGTLPKFSEKNPNYIKFRN